MSLNATNNEVLSTAEHAEQPVWYKPNLGTRLTPLMRKVLLEYSGIPADLIEEHVKEVRDRAWKLYKYPCIGQWQFLYSHTPSLEYYESVLESVKQGNAILDLGCCFAQDLRILAADGAPTRHMYASDIVQDFWPLGLDLFCDAKKFEATFVQADIFDPSSALFQLKGKIDVVLVTHFLHLFDRGMQIRAMTEVIRLIRPGGRIIGYNIGSCQPRHRSPQDSKGSKQANAKFYHGEESFKEMWTEIEHKTQTKWKVDVSLSLLEDWGMPKEDFEWMGPNARGLSFSVVQKLSEFL